MAISCLVRSLDRVSHPFGLTMAKIGSVSSGNALVATGLRASGLQVNHFRSDNNGTKYP